jgi:negative regulator of sigma E activity
MDQLEEVTITAVRPDWRTVAAWLAIAAFVVLAVRR